MKYITNNFKGLMFLIGFLIIFFAGMKLKAVSEPIPNVEKRRYSTNVLPRAGTLYQTSDGIPIADAQQIKGAVEFDSANLTWWSYDGEGNREALAAPHFPVPASAVGAITEVLSSQNVILRGASNGTTIAISEDYTDFDEIILVIDVNVGANDFDLVTVIFQTEFIKATGATGATTFGGLSLPQFANSQDINFKVNTAREFEIVAPTNANTVGTLIQIVGRSFGHAGQSLVLPTCQASQVLSSNGSTLSCKATPQALAVPTCTSGQVLTGDGTNLSCKDESVIEGLTSSATEITFDRSMNPTGLSIGVGSAQHALSHLYVVGLNAQVLTAFGSTISLRSPIIPATDNDKSLGVSTRWFSDIFVADIETQRINIKTKGVSKPRIMVEGVRGGENQYLGFDSNGDTVIKDLPVHADIPEIAEADVMDTDFIRIYDFNQSSDTKTDKILTFDNFFKYFLEDSARGEKLGKLNENIEYDTSGVVDSLRIILSDLEANCPLAYYSTGEVDGDYCGSSVDSKYILEFSLNSMAIHKAVWDRDLKTNCTSGACWTRLHVFEPDGTYRNGFPADISRPLKRSHARQGWADGERTIDGVEWIYISYNMTRTLVHSGPAVIKLEKSDGTFVVFDKFLDPFVLASENVRKNGLDNFKEINSVDLNQYTEPGIYLLNSTENWVPNPFNDKINGVLFIDALDNGSIRQTIYNFNGATAERTDQNARVGKVEMTIGWTLKVDSQISGPKRVATLGSCNGSTEGETRNLTVSTATVDIGWHVCFENRWYHVSNFVDEFITIPDSNIQRTSGGVDYFCSADVTSYNDPDFSGGAADKIISRLKYHNAIIPFCLRWRADTGNNAVVLLANFPSGAVPETITVLLDGAPIVLKNSSTVIDSARINNVQPRFRAETFLNLNDDLASGDLVVQIKGDGLEYRSKNIRRLDILPSSANEGDKIYLTRDFIRIDYCRGQTALGTVDEIGWRTIVAADGRATYGNPGSDCDPFPVVVNYSSGNNYVWVKNPPSGHPAHDQVVSKIHILKTQPHGSTTQNVGGELAFSVDYRGSETVNGEELHKYRIQYTHGRFWGNDYTLRIYAEMLNDVKYPSTTFEAGVYTYTSGAWVKD